MNKIVGIITLLVLIASCQSKTEDDAEAKTHTISHKVEDQVGVIDNGHFIVTHQEAIQKDWEYRLAYKNKTTKLKDFKIVKGVTEGDAAETYYLLCATSEDSNIKTAALLKTENGKFYFEFPQNSEHSYHMIICEGNCESGCIPIVKMYNNTKYLNCSSCSDCWKSDAKIP